MDVEEYVALMAQGGEADGLKVWVASMALGHPLNMIFESVVWSTSADSFDIVYQSLLMTSYCMVVLCEHAPDPVEQMTF